ncbi:class F sortase [Geodermatophilus sp. YIM 151500]|uniref:class F sortase n=1 Tax=Geodermatophilus sp. YIM 151500 TaxID=2984531 RepID=UPI0021E473FA|nr:class F sortase [Geodermatophilus sp. YIM 151500]MCV2490523.1 class F sortase [Geodermatophilus sp. YIM 151500]
MQVRLAAAGAVLGLALAIGVPTAWELTRPSAAAGAPVEEAVSGSPGPVPPPAPAAPTTSPPAPDLLPEATGRDARPTSAVAAPAPTRLVVPRLGMDAPVDQVAVRDDGQMELPEDVRRIGWYRFGPVPGAPGSAVIAGHVDDAEQGLGAIAPVRGAEVGDVIEVVDAAGSTTRWQVVSRELIEKQALPLDALFQRDGPPRLTLITCGGPFLPELSSYSSNVVVVAEPLG